MRIALFLSIAISLVGCSTHPVVTEVDKKQKDIAGIPFRIQTDQEVSVYRLKDDEDTYYLVSVTTQKLADQQRMFAINYSGGVFASRSLKAVQNSDNTLKSVQITSTDASNGAIDALNTTLAGATAADTAKKSAALSAAKNVVDADKAVRDAQKDLDALPNTASAETRANLERILESAKQQAAAARTVAG